jgi:hypothetical protein
MRKLHIEMYLHGFGWHKCHGIALESEYFSAVKELRETFGQHSVYRLVQTVTITARTVITSDYSDELKA